MAQITDPNTGRDWPATKLRVVTPSDTVDLTNGACRALHIGTAGDVTVIAKDDTAAVLIPDVPAGILPVSVLRVKATGTTAEGIVALY